MLQNQIYQFENPNEFPLHFVEYYINDKKNLEKVLKSKGLKLGKVVKKPIDGLVSYHLSIA